MNNTYRLIWNELANTWVAVAENAKSRGKRAAGALLLTAVAGAALAQTVGSQQLPTGGQIVSGNGAISAQGAAMTVNQNTARMIANWSSFNIGANASVNFVQPSASAVALNRIQSQDPTQIMGRLTANGQVMLVNPAGVVFGRGSQVDVGGLVASSLAISDANFLSGNYRFAADGTNSAGMVVNQGRITTPSGGAVAFLAPMVKNQGEINTPQGSTLLAAAQDITVDFAGDGLINYRVNAGAASALVENTGTVTADGGMAVLSAQSVDSITQGVVNNTGLVRAQRLENRDGRIVLEGQSVTQAGTLTANTISAHASGQFEQTAAGVMNADGGLTANGGSVRVDAGSDVVLSGRVSANGSAGGHIAVAAPEISVLGATLQAMGQGAQAGDGGTIRIGGGYQGKDTDIVNALRTRVLDSTLDVSAAQNGNAGTAIVWSEQQTIFNSTANAKGGVQGGNGGLVEVSSHDQLSFSGRVNASAQNGTRGRLLLDPSDITIGYSTSGVALGIPTTAFSTSPGTASTISYADIEFNLANGTALTLQANNNITVSANIDVTTASGLSSPTPNPGFSTGDLTLRAGKSITVNPGVMIDVLNANLTLKANDAGAVAANRSAGNALITLNGSTLKAGTGTIDISMGSGVNASATSGGIALTGGFTNAANVIVSHNGTTGTGIDIGAAVIDTDGGQSAAGSLVLSANQGGITSSSSSLILRGNSFNTVTMRARDDISLQTNTLNRIGSASDIGATQLYAGRSVSLTGGLELMLGNSPLTIRANYFDGNAGVSAIRASGIASITTGFSYAGIRSNNADISIKLMDGTGLTGATPTSGDITIARVSSSMGAANNLEVINNGPTAGSKVIINGAVSVLGTVNVATQNGNINLSGNIATTNTSAGAITLTAGTGTLAPTTTGGDIVLTGTRTLTTGAGGSAYLFSGSSSASTGLAALATAARTFYNVDPTHMPSSGVTTGIYALFRQNTLPLTLTLANTTMVYGDAYPTVPTYTLTSGSFNAGDSITSIAWGSAATAFKAQGTYAYNTANLLNPTFTCAAAGCASNYSLTFVNGLTISPRPITISADAKSMSYGGTAPALTYQITAGNLVSTDTLTGALSRTAGAHAGTYPINIGTLAASNNYAVTYAPANFTINRAVLTVSMTNTGIAKPYDGTYAAPVGFTPAFSVAGLASGDTANIFYSAVAYNDPHVASANKVTASPLSITSITGTNGSLASDYVLSATSAFAPATITPVPVTVSSAAIAGTLSKTYDGTTAAPNAVISGTVTGGITGDTLGLGTNGMTLAYSSPRAGSSTISASGTPSLVVTNSNAGSLPSDYSFTVPTIADVAGTITPRALTISASIGGSTTKTYDGTASAGGAVINGAVNGAVAGDNISLNTSAVTVAYDSAHVSSATALRASGAPSLVIAASSAGSVTSDYAYSIPAIADVPGSITPKSLSATASIGGTLSKTYDGTTVATGAAVSGSVSGAVAGDSLSLDTSPVTLSFNNAHVLNASTINSVGSPTLVIGTSSANSLPSDYSYTAPVIAAVSGSITPKILVASLTNTDVSKPFDGTMTPPVGFAPQFAVSGFIGGDSAASLSGLSAFNSADPATANAVVVSSLAIASISGANGSRTSDYVLDASEKAVSAKIIQLPPTLPPAPQSTATTSSLSPEANKDKEQAVASAVASAVMAQAAPQIKAAAVLSFGSSDVGVELVVSPAAASLTLAENPTASNTQVDTEVKTNSVDLFTQTGTTLAAGGALSIVEQGRNIRASSTTASQTAPANLNLAGMRYVNVDYRLPAGGQNQMTVGVSSDGVLVVKVPAAMKAASDDRSLALIGMATAKERLDVQPANVKGVVIQVE